MAWDDAVWVALLVSGGAAGLAGALEVAGPVGQLTPYIPVGYGFAAIIALAHDVTITREAPNYPTR